MLVPAKIGVAIDSFCCGHSDVLIRDTVATATAPTFTLLSMAPTILCNRRRSSLYLISTGTRNLPEHENP